MGLKLYQFLVTKKKKLYLLPKFHFTSNWNTTKTQKVYSKKGRELGMALGQSKKKKIREFMHYILHKNYYISFPTHSILKEEKQKREPGEKKNLLRVSVRKETAEVLQNRIQRNVQFIQFVGKSPIHFSTKNHVHSDEPKLSNKLKVNSICSVCFLKQTKKIKY